MAKKKGRNKFLKMIEIRRFMKNGQKKFKKINLTTKNEISLSRDILGSKRYVLCMY